MRVIALLGLVAICAVSTTIAQGGFAMPAWLTSFPGATPEVKSSDSEVRATYTVEAQPAEVLAHYRALFEAQGLAFQPNPDGMGTTIRAEAKECSLLILIRSRSDGTYASVDCSAKSDGAALSTGAPGYSVDVVGGKAKPNDWAERVRQHQAEFPALKANPNHGDQPAPPLEWPAWLVHVRGQPLTPHSGVDPTKYGFMTEKYKTNVAMPEIFEFYRNLLTAHGYQPRAEIAKGHTDKGVQQDAIGLVQGVVYPDGYPGPFTKIEVSMDRDVLNGPITVTMRFSTHGYKAGQGH